MFTKTDIRGSAIVAPLLGLALTLSACSGNDASASGPKLAQDELLAQADEHLAAASNFDQEFPIPTDAAPASGKKIAVMSGGFAAAIHAEMADFIEEAANASGAEVLGPFDGEFTPSVQGGYVDQAVQQEADAIVLFAVDVNTISSAVDRALDAGVGVICTLCYSGDYREKGVIDVTPDFEQQGETIAWNMIKRTGGKAKVLVADEPSQTGVVRRVAGMKRILDQCADCSSESLVIPAADLAQPGPPQFTAFLSANSGGFTDVAAYADALTSPVLRTLASTGGADVKVSGYDAEGTVVPQLADPQSGFVADVAAPLEFAAWAGVDQALRVANDLETWDSTDLPDVLLTPENVGEYEAYFAPSTDWKGAFTALWKP